MYISGTDIHMTRGDTEAIKVSIKGVSVSPDDVLEMTVRKRYGSPPVFYFKTNEFQDGSTVIPILPKDTTTLPFGKYVYDMQLTFGGVVKTIIKPSKFVLEYEVTYGD